MLRLLIPLMYDSGVTHPLPSPVPKAEGVTGAEAEALLAIGAGAFDPRRTSASRRGWEPPGVELLQGLLPQYEITALIARGGMGAVYKATQRALKRAVAIKVLPPEVLEGGDGMQFAARFQQEAQAMAQLSHPKIVAVFDAGEVDLGEMGEGAARQVGQGGRLLYFVMEFVEGTDVGQVIASEGRIEPQRAGQIVAEVCEALAFAHEEGIVHRDIKPSNIMIDRRGRVKVADFGLAKAVNVESTLMTRSDVRLGTPDFLAPEALIPGMEMDGRADIYAVGVMLYQMLTGKIPRGRFELPSGVVPQMDARFDAIVDRAMQADREKRYSTALEMKRDVERVGAGSAGLQPPSGAAAVAEAGGSLAKGRRRLVFGSAAAVLLGAGTWLLRVGPREAERSGAVGPGALPAALEARAIRLWDAPAKLDKAPGIRWENEAMRLDNAGPAAGPSSRNAILRASFRANADAGGIVLALRRCDAPAAQARLEVDLHAWKVKITTAAGGMGIGEWPLPRSYGGDEWLNMELRAIGDDFTVVLDGQVLGTAHSDALSRPGTALLYAGANGFFRDIVYIPLDDLGEAEARQAVGMVAESLPK
jgi:hypothetical protein